MDKPIRLPTASEINVHDTLDEREIVKHFLGKNLQETESLFRNNYGLMEELLWLGPKAFCFYIAAAIGYLHSPESEGNWNALYLFVCVIEFRLDYESVEIEPAKPMIRQALVEILTNFAWYDCERKSYEGLASELEALLLRL